MPASTRPARSPPRGRRKPHRHDPGRGPRWAAPRRACRPGTRRRPGRRQLGLRCSSSTSPSRGARRRHAGLRILQPDAAGGRAEARLASPSARRRCPTRSAQRCSPSPSRKAPRPRPGQVRRLGLGLARHARPDRGGRGRSGAVHPQVRHAPGAGHRAAPAAPPRLRHRHRGERGVRYRLRRDAAARHPVVPGRVGLVRAAHRPRRGPRAAARAVLVDHRRGPLGLEVGPGPVCRRHGCVIYAVARLYWRLDLVAPPRPQAARMLPGMLLTGTGVSILTSCRPWSARPSPPCRRTGFDRLGHRHLHGPPGRHRARRGSVRITSPRLPGRGGGALPAFQRATIVLCCHRVQRCGLAALLPRPFARRHDHRQE